MALVLAVAELTDLVVPPARHRGIRGPRARESTAADELDGGHTRRDRRAAMKLSFDTELSACVRAPALDGAAALTRAHVIATRRDLDHACIETYVRAIERACAVAPARF